jgi:DNA-binding SARP family transcriptional activator/ABC-type transporter Mla MlaB component
MMHARLFGDLAVWVDGRVVPPLQGLRPRSLMAYLLLHPGLHPRTRLAGRFWPDVLETSARASLRSALWSVRAALEEVGGAEYLHADRSSVGIAPELPRIVDVEEFDRLVSAGDPASLQGAVDVAAVPLLADLADEWALDAQDVYRERLVEVLEGLAASAEEAGDMTGAVRWTRAVLEHDRLRESAHRALMRRLHACGERAQALTAYRRARAVLAAELGVAPSRETRALAETLREDHAADRDASASPRRVDTPRRRAAAASREEPTLIGRDRELGMLLDVWAHVREVRGGLALISGPPGIGKSRLVAALVERARTGGARIASGAALELAGAPPLAPWLEALRDLIAAAAPPPDAAWPSDLARLSAVVESTWHRAPGAPALSPDLDRVRIFAAVLEMVAWSAHTQPLVLILEDLHRADGASLALLAHVGRRLGDTAALIVATRRLTPGNPELDLALDAIRHRRAVRVEVELDRLADEDVARLVGAAGLDSDLAARVVVAAEGNPLLASEGARAAGLQF